MRCKHVSCAGRGKSEQRPDPGRTRAPLGAPSKTRSIFSSSFHSQKEFQIRIPRSALITHSTNRGVRHINTHPPISPKIKHITFPNSPFQISQVPLLSSRNIPAPIPFHSSIQNPHLLALLPGGTQKPTLLRPPIFPHSIPPRAPSYHIAYLSPYLTHARSSICPTSPSLTSL
jgi:hypothetical protein